MLGQKLEAQNFTDTVSAENFASATIEWMRGKQITFRDCDFSHSLVKSSYFHRATFIRCKFVGTAFVDTNLRGAKFEWCDFEYATFRNTPVLVREVLKNAPNWENARRELARSLRKNYDALGDVDSAREAFFAEMEASCEHWRSAARGVTQYYIGHYQTMARLIAGLRYVSLTFSRWTWGYGESPLRLAISILVLNVLLALALVRDTGCSNLPMLQALSLQLQTFLGAVDPASTCKPSPGFMALETFCRLVTLGLVGTLVVRRFAGR